MPCNARAVVQSADQAWLSLVVAADFGWKKMALPILQQYQVGGCAHMHVRACECVPFPVALVCAGA